MKFRSAKRLKYGQTPWDRLARKELLLMVCRYHAALTNAACCLRVMRAGSESGLYWSPAGSGGEALAKTAFLEQLAGADTDDGRERIYRQFFRSAEQSLFPGLECGHGTWFICEGCNTMAACARAGQEPSKHCPCNARWRRFELADIRPDLAGRTRTQPR